MNFLPLTLSLLVTTCLAAADDSKNRSSVSKKITSSQKERVNVEPENIFNELRMNVNSEQNECFASFRSKHVSTKEALHRSLDELKYLESASKTCASDNFSGNNAHEAGSYLAKVVKLGKLLNVRKAAFNAWIKSRLPDKKFTEAVKEAWESL